MLKHLPTPSTPPSWHCRVHLYFYKLFPFVEEVVLSLPHSSWLCCIRLRHPPGTGGPRFQRPNTDVFIFALQSPVLWLKCRRTQPPRGRPASGAHCPAAAPRGLLSGWDSSRKERARTLCGLSTWHVTQTTGPAWLSSWDFHPSGLARSPPLCPSQLLRQWNWIPSLGGRL